MTHRFDGQKWAVWGAARSGIAAANLLVDLGARVRLSDNRPIHELSLEKLDPRVAIRGGENVFANADFLVPSPGIPPRNQNLQAARAAGLTIVSEIELAAMVAEAPIVAITGTDGKSTTTEMVGAVARACGRPTVVAGNIGVPLSERVRDVGPDGIIVAEVSAFQLWSCGHFSPDVAIITNIAEDHAEYFEGDVAAYVGAKARVLKDMGPDTTAVLRIDDRVVAGFKAPEGVSIAWFGPQPQAKGWGLNAGQLTRDGTPVLAASELPLPGDHNICNALSALAAGDALGLDLNAMLEGLKAFKGLPHRLEMVRERRGVVWYNDSKATNPHAAATGLKALSGPKIVITGGYEKGLDLAPFIEAFSEVKHVILTGTTAERMLVEMAGRWPSTYVSSMQAAVELADEISRDTKMVVLSPASSSFDAYRSYAHRGEVFTEAVQALEA